jgi:hypothetical protein
MLPGGSGGVGLDDMRYSATLSLLLVPAGRTGNLDFLDPSSEALSSIGGFSTSATYSGNAAFGVTSADEGDDVVFATDRTSLALVSIDPTRRVVTATLTLAATPGYVRYVATTNEVWVSEPSAKQIEVIARSAEDGGPGLSHAATIPVGGAESLEIDPSAGLAFTNTATSTITIDVASRSVVGMPAPNGCNSARGLAVDAVNGWVLVGCNEGRLVVLDERTGAMRGTVTTGGGVDRIAYDVKSVRAYVPSPAAASVAVVALSSSGVPKVLGSVQATSDAHCIVTPGAGQIFICVPSKGEISYLYDPF